MKPILLKIVLFVPCAVLAFGAFPAKAATNILVSSFDSINPANTRAVLRADGTRMEGELLDPAEGIVSIGYFDFTVDSINLGSDLAISGLQEALTLGGIALLDSAWVQFGTSSKVGPNFFIDSTYDFTTSDNLMAGSSFINKDVYTFIGNGLTYATSTELLVFNHNKVFTVEAPLGGPATVSLTDDIGTGTLLLGHFATSPHSLQAGNTLLNPSPPFPAVLSAFGLEPIPEPSRALFALLGVGAVLVRRRR